MRQRVLDVKIDKTDMLKLCNNHKITFIIKKSLIKA